MNPIKIRFYLLLIVIIFSGYQAIAQSVTISSSAENNKSCYGTDVTLTGHVTNISNPEFQWWYSFTGLETDYGIIDDETNSTYTELNLIQSKFYKLVVIGEDDTDNGTTIEIESFINILVYGEFSTGSITGEPGETCKKSQ